MYTNLIRLEIELAYKKIPSISSYTMTSNVFYTFPVFGWQNVALSSLGSVCQATSERNEKSGCEKALDGRTDAYSVWQTNWVGSGVLFYVRHFTLNGESPFNWFTNGWIYCKMCTCVMTFVLWLFHELLLNWCDFYPFPNFAASMRFGNGYKWFHPTLYNGCNYLSLLGLQHQVTATIIESQQDTPKRDPCTYFHGATYFHTGTYQFNTHNLVVGKWVPVAITWG